MGGRPSADKDKLEMAFKLYDEESTPVKDICDQFGISKITFFKYNRMRKSNEKQPIDKTFPTYCIEKTVAC